MGDLDNDAIDEYLEFSERALIGRGEGGKMPGCYEM